MIDNDDERYGNGFLKCARVHKVTSSPEGVVETWNYDSTGWPKSVSVPGSGGKTRMVEFAYSGVGGGREKLDYRIAELPRIVTEKFDGKVVSRQLHKYYPEGTDPDCKFVLYETQKCAAGDGQWDAEGNLEYSRLEEEGGSEESSETVLVLKTPETVEDGDEHQEVRSMSGSNVKVTARDRLRDIETTTEINPFGYAVSEKTTEMGVTVYSRTVTSGDAFGRPLHEKYNNGDTAAFDLYGLHGPRRVTQPDMGTLIYDYYATGAPKSVEDRMTGRRQTFEYDPLANVTKWTTSKGSDTRTYRSPRDALGRMTEWHDPLGVTTLNHTAPGGEMKTECTSPGNETVCVTCNKDGTVKAVDGSMVASSVAVSREGTDDGEKVTVDIGDRGRGHQATQNLLGQQESFTPNGDGRNTFKPKWNATTGRYEGSDTENGSTFGPKQVVNWDKGYPKEFGVKGRLFDYKREASGKELLDVCKTPKGDNFITSALADDGRTAKVTVGDLEYTATRSAYTAPGAYTLTLDLPGGRQVVHSYEKRRLARSALKDSAGNEIDWRKYTYTDSDRVETVESASGITTTYRYDSLDRLKNAQCSDPARSYSIDYDDDDGPSHRKATVRRGGGRYVKFETEKDGRVAHFENSDGFVVDYGHTDGLPTEMEVQKGGEKVKMSVVRNGKTGEVKDVLRNGVVVEERTYTGDGDIFTVTKPDSIGTATHRYDEDTKELRFIEFSDGLTPWIAIDHNELGHVRSSSHLNGVAESYTYTVDGRPLRADVTHPDPAIPATALVRTYRPGHPYADQFSCSYDCGSGSPIERIVGYLYDSARVTTLDDGNLKVVNTYAVLPLSGGGSVTSVRIEDSIFSLGGTDVLTRTIQRDPVSERITSITWTPASASGSGVPLASYTYEYVPDTHDISKVTYANGFYRTYGYDQWHRLTNAVLHDAAGTALPGSTFGYAYDEVGNTLRAGPLGGDGKPMYSFESDLLNAHVVRQWGSNIEIAGKVVASGRVTVNGQPCPVEADGTFRVTIAVPNQNEAIWQEIAVTAVLPTSGGGSATYSTTTGKLFCRKSAEIPDHSIRGARTLDSRFSYILDWHERLTTIVALASPQDNGPKEKLVFEYYPDGRRYRKLVYSLDGGVDELIREHAFYYDGWLPVREVITDHTVASTWSRAYIWSLDLAGWQNGRLGQDAGGIGGLVGVEVIGGTNSGYYVPICDHNGNIHKVIDASDGSVVANYEYSPFGVLIGEWGPKKDVCPFRFQTKYYDHETQLYYYGYRYYDPASTKWLTRDPLGEAGGINLTAFCGNDPVNRVDPLGLELHVIGRMLRSDQGWIVRYDAVAHDTEKGRAFLPGRPVFWKDPKKGTDTPLLFLDQSRVGKDRAFLLTTLEDLVGKRTPETPKDGRTLLDKYSKSGGIWGDRIGITGHGDPDRYGRLRHESREIYSKRMNRFEAEVFRQNVDSYSKLMSPLGILKEIAAQVIGLGASAVAPVYGGYVAVTKVVYDFSTSKERPLGPSEVLIPGTEGLSKREVMSTLEKLGNVTLDKALSSEERIVFEIEIDN